MRHFDIQRHPGGDDDFWDVPFRVETLVVMFRLRFLLVARESAGGAPLRLLQFSGVPPSFGTTTTSALLVSVVVVLFGKL